jgi:hypothetical protein
MPRYIPALSFKWLTPLYDPLLKWVMREETYKRRLIQQANIQPKSREWMATQKYLTSRARNPAA